MTGDDREQETFEAVDRRNQSTASENLDAADAHENYKVWQRIGQVLDDERVTDPGVVTTLVILARMMGDDDEVSIKQDDLAPLARVSKRTLHNKILAAEELGYIEKVTKGHDGDTNLYQAKGGWTLRE